MRTETICVVAVLGFALAASCEGQSPLPVQDITAVTAMIQRDFGSVDEIRTIGMSDEPMGRFDIVVVGSRRRAEGGWRVEVLSVNHHQLQKRWDSDVSAKEPEFDSSGAKSIEVYERDYDYYLLIEGCRLHECHDGIHGFLM